MSRCEAVEPSDGRWSFVALRRISLVFILDTISVMFLDTLSYGSNHYTFTALNLFDSPNPKTLRSSACCSVVARLMANTTAP